MKLPPATRPAFSLAGALPLGNGRQSSVAVEACVAPQMHTGVGSHVADAMDVTTRSSKHVPTRSTRSATL